jgi:hypothetical protein
LARRELRRVRREAHASEHTAARSWLAPPRRPATPQAFAAEQPELLRRRLLDLEAGTTPLHRAVAANQLEVVRALAAAGVSMELLDSRERTPLQVRGRRGAALGSGAAGARAAAHAPARGVRAPGWRCSAGWRALQGGSSWREAGRSRS